MPWWTKRCGVHLEDVHAVGVNLDFLRQEVEPAIVAIDDDFAVFGPRGIVSKLGGEDVGKIVTNVGRLVVHGVEHPVVLRGQSQQGNVVVGDIVGHARLETVGLLVVSLRGGAAALDADAADVVQVGAVVLVAQVIGGGVVDVQNLHRRPDFRLVGDGGAVVCVDDDDGQVGGRDVLR